MNLGSFLQKKTKPNSKLSATQNKIKKKNKPCWATQNATPKLRRALGDLLMPELISTKTLLSFIPSSRSRSATTGECWKNCDFQPKGLYFYFFFLFFFKNTQTTLPESSAQPDTAVTESSCAAVLPARSRC